MGYVACCNFSLTLFNTVSIGAKSVDTDQSDFWSMLIVEMTSKTFQQTTKADNLYKINIITVSRKKLLF